MGRSFTEGEWSMRAWGHWLRGATFLLSIGLVSWTSAAELIQKEGAVEVMKGGTAPQPASVGLALVLRDKLGTGQLSRAILKMTAGWNARIDEETFVEITQSGIAALDRQMLRLDRGQAFIYCREALGEWKIQTPAGTGTGKGTQIVVRVTSDGATFVQVIEGEFDFTNPLGSVSLQAGEAGEATPATAPRKTAVIETRRLLQWALYYPAVLQLEDLGLSQSERDRLQSSLDAYRAGDLLGALEKYPSGHQPVSPADKLYRAAVLLATGRVEAARKNVEDVDADHPTRRALERMIAAVLSQSSLPAPPATTASEALAESYYQQSRYQLEAARIAARRSTELASQSGFTWTRLAELEFSFGRNREARVALERGLALAPRHAQAHALRGFLLSAENEIAAARAAFEHAVQLDGALGNAWLGLGLTKIKQGDRTAGRADLQTAVTVEPTRAFLYSYHAKAIEADAHGVLAQQDLALAKQLDAGDPTAWLYSAMLEQQDYRYHAALSDLQHSLRLNDNRRVYRSAFLLDQDRAVRSSNLAQIYQQNGMADLAVREATRAVETDYTNPSAHQFLANSYDALRDPKQLTLRHETAWFNEQLLAYLLAPVGGGPLSQFISQQEYSKLLEADGRGGSLVTEARDDGTFSQKASLFFTRGRWSGGLDFWYRRDAETRPNNDNVIREMGAQLKYQASADDVLYGLVQGRNQKNGDLLQTYSNVPGNSALRFKEQQEPGLLLAGWNHRWAPGVHTLLLGGRLAAEQTLSAPGFTPAFLLRDPGYLQPDFVRPGPSGGLEFTAPELRNAVPPPVTTNPDGSLRLSPDFQYTIAPFLGRGAVTGIDLLTDRRFDLSTRRDFELYSGEVQHLWQQRRNLLLLGGRWQGGTFKTTARLDALNPALRTFAASPAADQNVTADFERRSIYAYDFLSPSPGVTFMVGGTWDRIERPDNFRNPPVNARSATTERVSGKLGVTFAPARWLTLRAIYTEALGGVSFDESVRLEPVQLAGFNQAFRTIIPESVVGSVETPVYKNAGLSLEGELPTRTWWAASFSRLHEDVKRAIGVFDIIDLPGIFPRGRALLPSSVNQELGYRENVFSLGLNQLLGREFALGVTYRFTRAELHDRVRQIPVSFNPYADDYNRADLEELSVTAHWNSPSGWLARGAVDGFSQDLHGTAGGQLKRSPPGDHFWHASLIIGRRFQQNRREFSVGVLNLNDRDFLLSPLTFVRDLPRERTFFARFRINF